MNTMTEARNLESVQRAAGKTRLAATEAFVETLVAHQIKDVFGVIGAPRPDAADLFPGAGIRMLSVAQRESAAHLAHGYGRAGNRLAVCVAPDGPGITDFVPAVASAYWARTPLVVVTPGAGGYAAGHGPMFSKITRWQTHVSSTLQVADALHRAF